MTEAQHYNDFPVLPLPLPPKETYAMLMGKIEQELLEDPSVLQKKFENEDTEARNIREKRYADAIEKFQNAYSAYMERWCSLFHQYKRNVNAYFERYDGLQNEPHDI